MGKAAELELAVADLGIGGAGGGGGVATAGTVGLCVAAIGRVLSVRCVVVLLLGLCVFLSALFWLPPFRAVRSGSDFYNPDAVSAEIQGSFVLQKQVSSLVAHVARLEYDILTEIGVPNSKVSIISMHSLSPKNSTQVLFGIRPDPYYASISIPALSVLRSSLVELVLEQLNLSLTPSVFGRPASFEIVRFPGGITVIPLQFASIWETTQVLFNFTLNNSIDQILKNLDELKYQLKFGLDLKSYENVYVQLTNGKGSTVQPLVTVQASVLSDDGTGNLLPDRLKQLAQFISGPDTKNLGLNHSVFGKVKGVQLSSYLQHSLSSLPPSPSPSPSPLSPSPSPSPSLSPSPTTSPSPCPYESGSHPPNPAARRKHSHAPAISPVSVPVPSVARPPVSEMAPRISPLAPESGDSSPFRKKGIDSLSPSPSVAPSQFSNASASPHMKFCWIALIGVLFLLY